MTTYAATSTAYDMKKMAAASTKTVREVLHRSLLCHSSLSLVVCPLVLLAVGVVVVLLYLT